MSNHANKIVTYEHRRDAKYLKVLREAFCVPTKGL
jgi:hypothetical protein